MKRENWKGGEGTLRKQNKKATNDSAVPEEEKKGLCDKS